MKMRILVALAALAVPAMSQAQTPEERIEAARAKAAAAGVPVSLIEAKIAEGLAKGVPMERLAAAVERREAALERAQLAMSRGGEDVETAELGVGADALGAGVSEAVLAEIAATTEGSRRSVAVAALTQLVAAGHVPEQALARVTEALARGDDALASLPEQASRRGPPAGAGRPAGAPGAPTGVGAPQVPAGPPAGVPAPGQKPTTTPPVSTPRGAPSGG
jgi:hypothetical protein